MKYFIKIAVLYIICTSSTCNDSSIEVNPGFFAAGYELPYNMYAPDTTFALERELTEISGLTYSTYSNSLLAINDELAYIYNISLTDGSVLSKSDFGKADDYEAIASHNKIVYVAESNGNIKVWDQAENKKITEYDDKLSRDNDIEGLTYDPTSNSILMAAKGDSREDGNEKDEKSIFTMNMSDGDIEKSPYLSVNLLEGIKELEKKDITKNILVNISISSRIKKYAPSGIAIHPETNDIYTVSAKGKLMVIFDKEKSLKCVVFLDQSKFVQPEGICFDSYGSLYISNEGRGRKATISVFHQNRG